MPTKKITLILLLVTALCIFCYYFTDRQLVWWLVAHHSRDMFALKIMANNLLNIVVLCVFLVYLVYLFCSGKFRLHKIEHKLIIMCNAMVVTYFLKDMLKLVFGRYWAATFICNNPSLVNNNVYGFNWFTSGESYASFPSGHTAMICAFSASMWLLFPALRWLWALFAILVMIGQAGMYYHYISDILAGAALGSVVALYNYRAWQRLI